MKTIPLDLSDRVKELLRSWTISATAATAQGPTRRLAPLPDDDRVLASATHVWLWQIPSAIHPKQLCHLHPDIANRFAQCWGDRVDVEALVDELLTDRRGQRLNLSARVVTEIERLELFHARMLRASFDPQQLLRLRRAFSGARAPGR